ncbi:hypothetical protein J8TS2_36810 [Lederbergia ruris]|uniref:Uncharacterized protein n=1 Tax=Lederbergia ruris TaxID=217495 RepID=A0ABQ4KN92_9BACI|nr:hypothetical protein J8TS2_36810 [Lederbergia ruris]
MRTRKVRLFVYFGLTIMTYTSQMLNNYLKKQFTNLQIREKLYFQFINWTQFKLLFLL